MRNLILAPALMALLSAPASAQSPAPPSQLGHSRPAHSAAKPHATPVVQPGHPPATRPSSSARPPPAAKPPAVVAAPAPAPEPPAPVEPGKGSVTGQPLPRWAALRAEEVNLRAGPGTRYPIEWVYHRRDLPVQIEREFEVWRLVEDQDGVKGWVHQATLVGRRDFVVKSAQPVTLRATGAEDAAAVAILKPGVVGRIRACASKASWCEAQVADFRGWLRRDAIYGVDAEEVIAP